MTMTLRDEFKRWIQECFRFSTERGVTWHELREWLEEVMPTPPVDPGATLLGPPPTV